MFELLFDSFQLELEIILHTVEYQKILNHEQHCNKRTFLFLSRNLYQFSNNFLQQKKIYVQFIVSKEFHLKKKNKKCIEIFSKQIHLRDSQIGQRQSRYGIAIGGSSFGFNEFQLFAAYFTIKCTSGGGEGTREFPSLFLRRGVFEDQRRRFLSVWLNGLGILPLEELSYQYFRFLRSARVFMQPNKERKH